MAISLLTALKVIPWGDVIEHAPKVLGAARKLLDRQNKPTAPEAAREMPAVPENATVGVQALHRQMQAMQADIGQLSQTQQQLAQTVTDLAEQNARLVSAVEVLRLRSRLLLWTSAVMAGLLVWVLWR